MTVFVVSYINEKGELEAFASSQIDDIDEMLYFPLDDDVRDIRIGGVEVDIS